MDNVGSEAHLTAWHHLGPDLCEANPDQWSTRTIANRYGGTAPHSESAVMERGSLSSYDENGIPCEICVGGDIGHFENLIGKDTSWRGSIC